MEVRCTSYTNRSALDTGWSAFGGIERARATCPRPTVLYHTIDEEGQEDTAAGYHADSWGRARAKVPHPLPLSIGDGEGQGGEVTSTGKRTRGPASGVYYAQERAKRAEGPGDINHRSPGDL